jgi:putative PEP-CTERM system histidine kinase
MLILGFLLVGTAFNLILGFLVQFKSYRKSLRLVLFGLAILFVAHLWIAYVSVFAFSPRMWFLCQRLLQGIGMLIALGCLVLTRQFLRDEDAVGDWSWGRWRMSLFGLVVAGVALGEAILWLPNQLMPALTAGSPSIIFGGVSLFIPTLWVVLDIYILYLLENTYRFAEDYQRRIARLCFIGLGSLAVFHVFYYARVLLYRELPEHFAEASSVVYGVLYPVVLAGFLRYRLGKERISVPRDTVYTSATVFLTGSAFLGVALTILLFRWLHLDFSYFERFLLAFTLCFLAVLVLGSGTMRRHISRWVNQNFYSRKYDYQEQFFRLHKTATSGADVDTAVTDLVENMKYSVTVDDAYFFILNWQDGNFYQHENKEESTRRGLVISGDSPLARSFAPDNSPLDLLADDEERRHRRQEARKEPLVEQLRFDAVFPVFIGDRLAGILALQGGRVDSFDREDLDLIEVFTNSIGDALFKNRVFTERIEQKQFESFHHIASFIIHDIKNQVATLSLMLKNAERNLGNPSFQTSMLSSVKSCAGNLQSLIDRLSVAPKSESLALASHPLRPLLDEVVANSGLASLASLTFELRGEEGLPVSMDRQALFFVIRNLVNNSLEAMGSGSGRGRVDSLTLSHGPLGQPAPARLRDLFGGGDAFFASYGGYVLVEDNGAGMTKDFVQRRLFQPFATTKEKGVGIGLYQCKTLVEKMGGRILCHSELGAGTEFCILLPSAQVA